MCAVVHGIYYGDEAEVLVTVLRLGLIKFRLLPLYELATGVL